MQRLAAVTSVTFVICFDAVLWLVQSTFSYLQLKLVTHDKVFFGKSRTKSCTCVMKTFAVFLLSKQTFTIRTCSILASFFRKLLSKATFERKLFGVSVTNFRERSVIMLYFMQKYPCSQSQTLLVAASRKLHYIVVLLLVPF